MAPETGTGNPLHQLDCTWRRTPQLTSGEGEGGRETARIHMTSGRADSDGRTPSDARTLTAEDPAGRRSWADRGGMDPFRWPPVWSDRTGAVTESP